MCSLKLFSFSSSMRIITHCIFGLKNRTITKTKSMSQGEDGSLRYWKIRGNMSATWRRNCQADSTYLLQKKGSSCFSATFTGMRTQGGIRTERQTLENFFPLRAIMAIISTWLEWKRDSDINFALRRLKN